MKNTFLVRKYKANGKPFLIEVSGDEWKEIIVKNKSLPAEDRRYFIAHCIKESDGIDRMYIEVSMEEYQKWNSENTVKAKKRQYEKKYTIISMEDYAKPSLGTTKAEVLLFSVNGSLVFSAFYKNFIVQSADYHLDRVEYTHKPMIG